jgi:cysteinyl-tRNA synthetase
MEEEKASTQNGLTDNLMGLLIQMRVKAKEGKDYALADQIRDELSQISVYLKDSAEGTSWTHEQ